MSYRFIARTKPRHLVWRLPDRSDQQVSTNEYPTSNWGRRIFYYIWIVLHEIFDDPSVLPPVEVAIGDDLVSELAVEDPLIHVWNHLGIIAGDRNPKPKHQHAQKGLPQPRLRVEADECRA